MNDYFPFVNLPLPYSYDALEPYIDTLTMHLHHDRHLKTYVDNLNAALKGQPALQKLSLEELVTFADRLPKDTKAAVKNNAGGVYNHRFYFDSISPAGTRVPVGKLAAGIDKYYGSFDGFLKAFKSAALSVFGSGYAWLCVKQPGRSGVPGSLTIITTPNQDTPLTMRLCPLLNVDVWEHAYYLKHYNLRASYIENWFHVINWDVAEGRYLMCF